MTIPLDLAGVRRAFDRASTTFDASAVLHTEVRTELLRRLDYSALAPRLVLDAGAGTGLASRAVKRRYPSARVLALDSSGGMLRQAARRSTWLRPFERVCADAHALPLPDGCVDLIVSNLLLHWCDPDLVLAEFRRVLRHPGSLCLTSFGPDTLRELRSSWAAADGLDHVHPFIDMHDLGDALVRAGFAAPVLDVERYTLDYADFDALAADLGALGARNRLAARPRGLTGKRRFAAMREAYETQRRDGRLPATCEVVFAQAWTPAQRLAARPPAEPTFSLAALKAQLRVRRGA